MKPFLVLMLSLSFVSGAYAEPAKILPGDRQVPAVVDGKAATVALRSFFGDRIENLVVIFETDACDVCDRAALSNRALGEKLFPQGAQLVHVVTGNVANPEKLLKNRYYKYPVLFDLDGALAQRYAANPAKAPNYVLVGRDDGILMNVSGQSANPAAVQTAVMTALMIRKTQVFDKKEKKESEKPATQRKP